MPTTFSSPGAGTYKLGEKLINDTPIHGVHEPLPNEGAREDLLLKKLGARGWGRMHHFRYYYQPRWGESRCKSLSPRATEAFFRFLESVKVPEHSSLPSLFLTDQGGLELRWEHHGKDIQVEFTGTGIEIYCSPDDQESTASHSQASELAKALSAA